MQITQLTNLQDIINPNNSKLNFKQTISLTITIGLQQFCSVDVLMSIIIGEQILMFMQFNLCPIDQFVLLNTH